eukprot:4671281-Prymnesium_polylepis.1
MFGYLAFASTTSKKYEKYGTNKPCSSSLRGAKATSRRVRRSALRRAQSGRESAENALQHFG